MKRARRLPAKLVHEVKCIALTQVSFPKSFGDSNERHVPFSGGVVMGQGAWQYIERYPEMGLEPRDKTAIALIDCSGIENRGQISKASSVVPPICEGAKSTELAENTLSSSMRLRTERRRTRFHSEGVENGPVATSDSTNARPLEIINRESRIENSLASEIKNQKSKIKNPLPSPIENRKSKIENDRRAA